MVVGFFSVLYAVGAAVAFLLLDRARSRGPRYAGDAWFDVFLAVFWPVTLGLWFFGRM